MKALFTFGAEVPASRVIADHRRWLIPAGVVVAINIIVLLAVVLPLRQSVASGSSRADASAQSLRQAVADLKEAEATRDGQTQSENCREAFSVWNHLDVTRHTSSRSIIHYSEPDMVSWCGIMAASWTSARSSIF